MLYIVANANLSPWNMSVKAVLIECRPRVIPMEAIAIMQRPVALTAEISYSSLYAHGHIDPTAERKNSRNQVIVIAQLLEHFADKSPVVIDQLCEVALDENIGIEQYESFWENAPQIVDSSAVLVATPVVYRRHLVWIFSKKCLEVNQLPVSIIQHHYSVHRGELLDGGVVEDSYPTSGRVLPNALHRCRCQFGGVEVYDNCVHTKKGGR